MRRRIISGLLVLVTALSMAGGLWAESIEELKIRADQGDADAQTLRGLMYHGGLGERQDYAEAAKWLRKAAEQGNTAAQSILGDMYADGQGVPQNYAEAARWWRKAAEQGAASAQVRLGLMYSEGQGIRPDYAEAVKWYRKAAEQGKSDGQNNLGLMYANGQGVPKNLVEAGKWWRKAAEQGYAESQYNIGVMYRNGWGVPRDNTEAAKWYRKAAEQGHVEAQQNLAAMYDRGEGQTKVPTSRETPPSAVQIDPALLNRSASAAAPQGIYRRNIGWISGDSPIGNSQLVEINGNTYYYENGMFWVQQGNRFMVVAAPIGAVVNVLPPSAERLQSKQDPTYYWFGAFFGEKDRKYEVLLPPTGVAVSYLPDGYKRGTVNNATLYVYEDICFRPVLAQGVLFYQVDSCKNKSEVEAKWDAEQAQKARTAEIEDARYEAEKAKKKAQWEAERKAESERDPFEGLTCNEMLWKTTEAKRGREWQLLFERYKRLCRSR